MIGFDVLRKRRAISLLFFLLASLLACIGCSGGEVGSRQITGVKEPTTPGSGGGGTTTGTARDAGTIVDPPGTGGQDAGNVVPDASIPPTTPPIPPIPPTTPPPTVPDAGIAIPDAGGSSPDAGPPRPAQWLVTTSDLNLRTGPSTADTILRVIPQGSLVELLDPAPVNNFLHVDHQGLVGWAHRDYLRDANPTDAGNNDAGGPRTDAGTGQPPTGTIAAAIERAKSGVGFSYWWGHGRWLPTGPTAANKGTCTGGCPDCTHTGSYGADCSGYVGQIWQVPASNNDITVDKHPYSTANFVVDSSLWSTITREQLKLGDSLVYNEDGAGHIFLYASGDGWGSMDAYECKGCAAGCVFNLRTAGSAFKAIRRTGY
jgi:uncharacterized protein YraI